MIGLTTLAKPFRAVLDVVAPPQCMTCGGLLAGQTGLCAACWDGIAFLGPPECPRCGFPFEFDMGPEIVCGAYLRREPLFDRARAAFRYDEASRRLVLDLKHGDRTHTVPALARLLQRAGAALLADADVIVPVPLHWRRLARRRFNQAALLARALGGETGVPVAADALIRTRPTPSQGRLSRAQRRRNVRGAFALRPAATDAIRKRRVLLVDDVLTTGATAEAATRALRRGGAEAVDVLVLARVVRPQSD